ncbi:MAG: hypothetical protein WD513_07775 [Balneolaceae bacterium]
MKVAVTDACIFIDLLESEACFAFFQLQFEIVTTRQVWMELESDQRNELEKWMDSGLFGTTQQKRADYKYKNAEFSQDLKSIPLMSCV